MKETFKSSILVTIGFVIGCLGSYTSIKSQLSKDKKVYEPLLNNIESSNYYLTCTKPIPFTDNQGQKVMGEIKGYLEGRLIIELNYGNYNSIEVLTKEYTEYFEKQLEKHYEEYGCGIG